MKKRFLICKHCGNMVEMVYDAGVPVICCGEPMHILEANTVDAAEEKHVPVVSVEGNTAKVVVGSVEHPMAKEHYIMWIALIQGNKIQRVDLNPEEPPKAEFCIEPGKEMTVFAYCNLHGLWTTK